MSSRKIPRPQSLALISLCALSFACTDRPPSRDGKAPEQIAGTSQKEESAAKMPTTQPARWKESPQSTRCQTASFALG